jgi:heptosyltransferase-2
MDLSKIKKILVIRTDRIGDVLLSTPALANLRKALPKAYIAIMVTPYAKDIVVGNPNIDEVILYDKNSRHKGWLASIRFALSLRKKGFGLALILHPTNRSHIIPFLAGIKHRLGYDKKFPFLLTQRIPETKFKGEKHERDYVLDLVSSLGVAVEGFMPFMPIRKESESWAEAVLKNNGIDLKQDKVVAIHPGASCPSKRWSVGSFAEVAKALIKEKGVKIALIAAENVAFAHELAKLINSPSVINLADKTTVSQLASFLKRSRLFISNDSGPVHIACAVGTPVISIFGRNQAGLSPKRWGPLSKGSLVLHKEVGCAVCLAHNCQKGFLCLKSITPEEVISLACSML